MSTKKIGIISCLAWDTVNGITSGTHQYARVVEGTLPINTGDFTKNEKCIKYFKNGKGAGLDDQYFDTLIGEHCQKMCLCNEECNI